MEPAPPEPRLAPLPPAEWPPQMRDALAGLRPPNPRHPYPTSEGRPKGLNVLGTFAHHPELTLAFMSFYGHVLFQSTLTPRQRELLVLRVAAQRDAAYEWAQHVVVAADSGITEDEIERVTEGPDAPGWSPLERAMLRAVDELLHDATIGDATWAVLRDGFDDQQLLDLVFTVGAYDVLAMALNVCGTPLDDDLRR
jgi:alkylhydroperoxidase family enzyme